MGFKTIDLRPGHHFCIDIILAICPHFLFAALFGYYSFSISYHATECELTFKDWTVIVFLTHGICALLSGIILPCISITLVKINPSLVCSSCLEIFRNFVRVLANIIALIIFGIYCYKYKTLKTQCGSLENLAKAYIVLMILLFAMALVPFLALNYKFRNQEQIQTENNEEETIFENKTIRSRPSYGSYPQGDI